MTSLLFFVSIEENFIFPSIRQNLIRIPEVLLRLKEAEVLLNQLIDQEPVDLIKIMQSKWALTADAKTNLSKHLQLEQITQTPELLIFQKKLHLIASYASQIAIFDRYIKFNAHPDFVMYNSHSDKAALVSLKKYPIKKIIKDILQGRIKKQKNKDLSSYVIFSRKNRKYRQQEKIHFSDFKFDFEAFVLKEKLKAFVHLGPGQSMRVTFSKLSSAQFTELESISTDPLLNWFWTDIRLPVFSAESKIAV